MEKSIRQFEKNVQASFGYVKKDLLMLNDAVSDIHDKIQHLKDEIENLKEGKSEKKKAVRKK